MSIQALGLICAATAIISGSIGNASPSPSPGSEQQILGKVLSRPNPPNCGRCIEDEIGDLGIVHKIESGNDEVNCFQAFEGGWGCHSYWIGLPCWHDDCGADFDASLGLALSATKATDWRQALITINRDVNLRINLRRGTVLVVNCAKVIAASFPLRSEVVKELRAVAHAEGLYLGP